MKMNKINAKVNVVITRPGDEEPIKLEAEMLWCKNDKMKIKFAEGVNIKFIANGNSWTNDISKNSEVIAEWDGQQWYIPMNGDFFAYVEVSPYEDNDDIYEYYLFYVAEENETQLDVMVVKCLNEEVLWEMKHLLRKNGYTICGIKELNNNVK